jgi:hypothetical protein
MKFLLIGLLLLTGQLQNPTLVSGNNQRFAKPIFKGVKPAFDATKTLAEIEALYKDYANQYKENDALENNMLNALERTYPELSASTPAPLTNMPISNADLLFIEALSQKSDPYIKQITARLARRSSPATRPIDLELEKIWAHEPLIPTTSKDEL